MGRKTRRGEGWAWNRKGWKGMGTRELNGKDCRREGEKEKGKDKTVVSCLAGRRELALS